MSERPPLKDPPVGERPPGLLWFLRQPDAFRQRLIWRTVLQPPRPWRGHPAAQVDRIASSLRYLNALMQLLARMAEQRSDPNLDELIDDADTLAEACYRPIVDYCRTSDVPLSSNRTAAVFGDDCSPSL